MDALDWSQNPRRHNFLQHTFTLLSLPGNATSTTVLPFSLTVPILSLSPVEARAEILSEIWGPSQFLLWTSLPALIALITVLYDISSSRTLRRRCPDHFGRFGRALKSPFTDFLTLEDLDVPAGSPGKTPLWKTRATLVLSTVQAVLWTTVVAYRLAAREEQEGWLLVGEAAGSLVSWVSFTTSRYVGPSRFV